MTSFPAFARLFFNFELIRVFVYIIKRKLHGGLKI